jgi:hypothetical protein
VTDPYAPLPRLLGVLARTAHLFAMAVLVGGIWVGAPRSVLTPWGVATIVTGLLLLASEVSHDPRAWPFQVGGLAVLAHVSAMGLMAVNHRAATLLAVVIGAVGSHAPKRLRKWSLREGKAPDRRGREG